MEINIIKYWLTSLRDSELIDSSGEVFNQVDRYLECSQQTIADGHLSVLETTKLLELLKADSKLSKPDDEADNKIIVCPLLLVPNNKSGLANSIAPMWMPAKVEANGHLLPDGELLPWLARQLLSPQTSDIGIGDVDEFDRFLLDRECPQEDWEDYYKFCLDLFSTVTGQELGNFNLPTYFPRSNAAIAPNKLIKNISQPIQRIYEQIIGYPKHLNKTLKNLISTTDRPLERLLTPGEQAAISRLHLGEMQGQHPLSTSQREALYHFLNASSEGEILAINGPPGTGKTTLVQSAIASLWVKRALDKGEPPIIVASSTNNQAVTNIIASFANQPSSNILSQRWLPQIDSYGSFLASSGKFKEENNWQKISTSGQGFMAEMESKDRVETARAYFIDRCQEFLDRPIASVNGALKTLHYYLQIFAGKMYESIDSCSIEDMENTQCELDLSHRYGLFLLATHYWEARWLEDCSQLPEKSSQCLQTADWYRYAKLTPCFVSTFHMVPRFFSPYDGGYKIMWNFIDLLIVDEAGQVSPEVAGASFALAKQALVVGDTLQIEPVWSISAPVDAGNLIRNRIDIEVDDFKELGLSAANGSIMAIAQRASRYQKFTEQRGMFLSEHRRCVDEIIEYCNSLCYKGKLEPMRGSLSPDQTVVLEDDVLLPAMGYLQVAGKAEKSGSSRYNQIEAHKIAEWLVLYRQVLEQHYQRPLCEIVGVITPFKRQAAEIKRAIEQTGIVDLTVGTVHTLQGAERSIVIFSSTYDRSQGSQYFFDRQPNILNVAVSRAKDSFLVFGDCRILDAKQSTPSGILASMLFSSERNSLPELSRGESQPNPIEEGKRHRERGNLKFEEDPQQALVEFNRAIELNPQDAEAYHLRGCLKDLHLNDGYGALSDFNQAIELDPEEAIYYYNRGIIKRDFMDYEGALSDFDRSISIDPDCHKSYYQRGLTKCDYCTNILFYDIDLTTDRTFDAVVDMLQSARIAWAKEDTKILKSALGSLKSLGIDFDPSQMCLFS